MSNTLKFGNGTWATKKGSTLAYNDENNNYKPLPFNFERNSIATRVNKEGLIEVVGNNIPRIDYKDSEDGVFLLEKAATNLVTYSEDFSQWIDYNASAVLSEETIYGKNAYKIVEDNTTNYHGIYLPNLFTADGTNYISSVYVKGAERRYVVLTGRAGISSNDSAVIFDTQNGEWVLDISAQNQAFSSESVGNGWWRISIEGNPTSGAYDNFTIAASTGYNNYLDANYQGDGTSGFYVAFAQLETGNLSSYIPTSGSAVPRAAETCNNSGNSEVFNDSEGVLIAEVNFNEEQTTSRYISINDGGSSDRVLFGVTSNTSNLKGFVYQNNQTPYLINTDININYVQKIALLYKTNLIQLYLNGFKIDEITTAVMPTGLNKLSFNDSVTADFYGKTKEIGYYDTSLTDEELEYITSYRSLNELVTELNLNEL